MKQPDDQALLVDMLLAAREARLLCVGLDLEDFLESRVLQLAIQRLIEIIGEAASRLSGEGRESLPDLPWRDMVAMRNRLIHDYAHVNLAKVWAVVADDLDVLIDAIETLVPPDDEGANQ